jgi:hypothetical protein
VGPNTELYNCGGFVTVEKIDGSCSNGLHAWRRIMDPVPRLAGDRKKCYLRVYLYTCIFGFAIEY